MKYTRKKQKHNNFKRKSKRHNKLNKLKGGRKKRSIGRMGHVV